MTMSDDKQQDFESLDIPLERDVFLRTLIRDLSGTLQDVVGEEEAAGFISVAGQRMGQAIGDEYRSALETGRLTRDQAINAMLDLKRRIQGDFYVLESDKDKVVFGNRQCPFAEKVLGRPTMCMMTSNVFGSIGADSVGYAKVALEETIAKGDKECRVVVYLRPSDDSRAAQGREYFGDEAPGH